MTAPTYSGNYKALVCIFLNGGNQSFNWVVPNDSVELTTLPTINVVNGKTYVVKSKGIGFNWDTVAPNTSSWAVSTSSAVVVGSTFTAGKTMQLTNGTNVIELGNGPKYTEYKTSRQDLSVPRSNLWPLLDKVASDGHPYGLHPSCKDLARMFNEGDAAVICNVGTLITATTKAEILSYTAKLPPQLFSHNDQQGFWQKGAASFITKTGWGGRVIDSFVKDIDQGGAGITPQLSLGLSPLEKSIFLSGDLSSQYITGSSATPTGAEILNTSWRDNARAQIDTSILSLALTDSNPLVKTYAQVRQSADQKINTLKSAFTTTVVNSTFPVDWVATQLKQIARIIKSNAAAEQAGQLTDNRQIFYAVQYGFDGHDYEYESQIKLLQILNDSIAALADELKDAGLWDNVVIFTNSEFGRSLAPNYDGSDHAWGGHSMVFGGAVNGGYYGTMPSLVLGSSDDYSANTGRLIPTTANEQYAATLAKWIGIDEADLDTIFPYLKNFPIKTLGFL